MRISVEKASDGTYIVEVPRKPKKDKRGNEIYQNDLKYTAKTTKEAMAVIAEALKEVPTPDDEYGIAYDEASKEPSTK